MDRDFLAWFAGFWEGEGNLYIWKGKTKHKGVQLSITQNDPCPLLRIQSTFGGTVRRAGTTKAGNPYYRWSLEQIDQIRAVWAFVRPFLVFRGKTVDRVLKETETMVSRRRKK